MALLQRPGMQTGRWMRADNIRKEFGCKDPDLATCLIIAFLQLCAFCMCFNWTVKYTEINHELRKNESCKSAFAHTKCKQWAIQRKETQTQRSLVKVHNANDKSELKNIQKFSVHKI